MTEILQSGVIIYLLGAGWQDLRRRRINNGWSATWGLFFLVLHISMGTWAPALLGCTVMAVSLFWPTLRGWWGVGDYKLAIVLGLAVGAGPALLVWFLGCMVAKWLQPVLKRVSLRFMGVERAATIPLATVIAMLSVPLFTGLLLR